MNFCIALSADSVNLKFISIKQNKREYDVVSDMCLRGHGGGLEGDWGGYMKAHTVYIAT